MKRQGSSHLAAEGLGHPQHSTLHERSHSNLSVARQATATATASAFAVPPNMVQKYVIWPEWSDADLVNEKWEGVAAKSKEKKDEKKSLSFHFFDDPEGKLLLPDGLRAASWRRPSDYMKDLVPTVVDVPGQFGFDLVTPNEHLIRHSETLRWIISQIHSLWYACATRAVPSGDAALDCNISVADSMVYNWRPWEHVYSLVQKSTAKGGATAANYALPTFNYNPAGKYLVKLFWLGQWRKIAVDDTMPFDDYDRPLLPVSTIASEIWPLVVCKALLKIAALTSAAHSVDIRDFKDFSPIYCFTGWIPEILPVQRRHRDKIWDMLHQTLPKWDYEDPVFFNRADKRETVVTDGSGNGNGNSSGDGGGGQPADSTGSALGKRAGVKGDEKNKLAAPAAGKTKTAEKEKEKGKEKGSTAAATLASSAGTQQLQHDDLGSLTDGNVALVFAAYSTNFSFPPPVSVLSKVADDVTQLHECGLAASFSHPVLLRKARTLPLERPPPVEPLPEWKKIRPRRNVQLPNSEARKTHANARPLEKVEFFSPLLHFRLAELPLPVRTSRSASALERRGTKRPRSASAPPVQELDEAAEDSAPFLAEPGKPQPQQPTLTLASETRSSRAVGNTPSKRSASVSPSTVPGTPLASNGTPMAARRAAARDAKSGRGLRPAVLNPAAEPAPALTAAQIPKLDVATHTAWLDVQQIVSCFRTIVVFHKPNSYPHMYKMSDQELIYNVREKDKKGATSNANSLTVTQIGGTAVGNMTSLDDKATPLYLFVDSLKPVNLLVSLSSLCTWHDASGIVLMNASAEPPPTRAGKKDKEHRDSREVTTTSREEKKFSPEDHALTVNSYSALDSARRQSSTPSTPTGELFSPPSEVAPGMIVFETHSWLRTESTKPIMILKSTGVRSTILSLPPGRHLFHIIAKAPIAHTFVICSQTPFFCGDEDAVLQFMTKESALFIDYGANILRCVGKLIKLFTQHGGNSEQAKEQIWEIRQLLLYVGDGQERKGRTIQLFREALYSTVKRALADSITKEYILPWRALTFDSLTESLFGVIPMAQPAKTTERESAHPAPPKEPAKAEKQSGRGRKTLARNKEKEKEKEAEEKEKRGRSSTPGSLKDKEKSDKLEKDFSAAAHMVAAMVNKWHNRELTQREDSLLRWLQKRRRGYFVRRIKQARTLGTTLHAEASSILQKSLSVLEANLEQNGLQFLWDYLRLLAVTHNPQSPPPLSNLMAHYPFSKDEPFMMLYSDHSDALRPPPAVEGRQQWFMVFRESFQLSFDTLLAMKLSTVQAPNVAHFVLHVIDNDTLQEVPTVFGKPAAHVYLKNRTGYTMLAQARLNSLPSTQPGVPPQIAPSGANARWKLRIFRPINTPQMKMLKAEVTSQFAIKEIKDYFVPSEGMQLVRLQIKWTGAVRTAFSAYLEVSNPDVMVRLRILDHTQEEVAAKGRQNAFLRLAFLKPDSNAKVDTEKKRSSARSARRQSPKKAEPKAEATTDEDSNERPASQGSSMTDVGDGTRQEVIHKYILEAHIVRNKQGELWKLNDADVAHVQQLLASQQQTISAVKTGAEVGSSANPLHSPNTVGGIYFGSGSSLVSTITGSQVVHNNMAREREQASSRNEKRDTTSRVSRGEVQSKQGNETKKRQAKDKQKEGTPIVPIFDETKAHYSLMLVFDTDAIDNVELRLDTDLQEHNAAMKRGWEAADPGREERGKESRAKFLLSNTKMANPEGNLSDVQQDLVVSEPTASFASTKSGSTVSQQTASRQVATASTTQLKASVLDPSIAELLNLPVITQEQLASDPSSANAAVLPHLTPVIPEKRLVLQPLDLSQFRVGQGGNPRLKTAEIEQLELASQKTEIEKFKEMNDKVEKYRIDEMGDRNVKKYLSLHGYDKQRAHADRARAQVFILRHNYRQNIIEAIEARQRAELQAKMEQEALLLAAKERERKAKRGKSPKSPRSSSSGKSTKA